MNDHLDEDDVVAALTAELLAKTQPLELVLHPVTAFQLTGLIQLALRRPDLSPELRDKGALFLAGVREYFAECPTVLAVVRKGDDPTYDVRPTWGQ